MTTVYNQQITLTVRGLPDLGDSNATNSAVLVGQEMLLEVVEGPKGPAGPNGPDSWPWIWQSDVADLAAWNALGLTTANAGEARRNVADNSILFWTGYETYEFEDAFQAQGPQGYPNILSVGTVTATTGSASAELIGTSPNQVLNLVLKKGATGATGSTGIGGSVRGAPDFDATLPAKEYDGFAWRTSDAMFRGMPYGGWRGPWAVGSSQIPTKQNVNKTVETVCSFSIPAQPMAWRPFILGQIPARTETNVLNDARMDFEVRIGSQTGQVCAKAWGTPAANILFSAFQPYFGPSTTVSPSMTVGTIPAGQTTTFYVVAIQGLGSKSFSFTSSGAEILVWAQPVYP